MGKSCQLLLGFKRISSMKRESVAYQEFAWHLKQVFVVSLEFLIVRDNLIKKVNKRGRYIWFVFLPNISFRASFSTSFQTSLYNHSNWCKQGDFVVSQPFPQLFITAHTVRWKGIQSTLIHSRLCNYCTEHPFTPLFIHLLHL